MKREWRVVSKARRGTFKVFDDDEEAARDFCTLRNRRTVTRTGQELTEYKRGGHLMNDPLGEYGLQSRAFGTQGNDSTWTYEEIHHENQQQ